MPPLFVEEKLPMTIPASLQLPLQANPHLLPRFFQSIQRAVSKSFEDKDTKMRRVTTREVKRRWELCTCAITMMYYDNKVTLIHAFDILSGVLRDTLLMESGALQRVKGPGQRRWTSMERVPEIMEVDMHDDLNE
jgi:hypothetical protein